MSTTSSSSKSKGAASKQNPKKARSPNDSKPNSQSKSKKESKVKDISAGANSGGKPANKDPEVDDISAKTGPEERSTEATSGTPNDLPAPPEDRSTKSPPPITPSPDSQWQPAGRIRKSGRPKKELHNLPALRIGSADTPNAKLEERERIDGEPFETEEFNAHISEKIHSYSTRRGGAAPSGMTRGIPKNVLVER